MKCLKAIGTALVIGLASSVHAAPVPTSFTYQGSLSDNGTLVDGSRSFEFRLWDSVTGGSQIGPTLSTTTNVAEGVFSEALDFGVASYAANQALWLEIIVEGQSMGRTPLHATPFSLNTRGLVVSPEGYLGLGAIIPGITVLGPQVPLDSFGGIRVREGQRNSPPAGEGMEFKYSNSADIAVIEVVDRDAGTFGDMSLVTSGGRLAVGRYSARATLDVEGSATFSGNVGIGTATPGAKLEAAGAFRVIAGIADTASGGAGLEFSYRDTGGRISAFNRATNTPRNLELNPFGGRVGIGTISPATALDVNGAVTIRGGADIVEGFESACGTAFEPGTVLVIDPSNPGMLMCSKEVYDGKVAGVVSGANGIRPGIKLGQDGVMDGEISVAMTGRVYVKCSTENGVIQPGDRLTTSSIRGHAMKATDGDLSDGAVIGKAMSGLDESTGMVLVLVNLQ